MFLALLGVGLFALIPHPALGTVIVVLLVVAGIACFCAIFMLVSGYLHWRRVFRDFQKNDIPRIKSTLDRGQVHSKHVTASSVIVIEEWEDEGSGYVFDIGEGKSLLLKGQKFLPVDERMSWPSSDFEIVRSPVGDLWIGLFSAGDSLPPSKTISNEICRDDFVESEIEEVVEDDPDAVLRRIIKVPRLSATRDAD
jgi:hypothetical protein